MNTLITHIQLFGVGFGLGIAGPCLLVCAPIVVAYLAGAKRKISESLKGVGKFLCGKLCAYVMLAGFAGLSGGLLKHFVSSNTVSFFKPAAGAIAVLFGIVLILRKIPQTCASHNSVANKRLESGGLFTLGFALGVAPCGPLTALLLEITLISKGALDGALYGLSFGLGAFLAGLLSIGAMSGALARIPLPAKIFSILSGALLMLMGVMLLR